MKIASTSKLAFAGKTTSRHQIFAETSTCTNSQTLCKSRSSYFWNPSSELDTLVNQNGHAAPIIRSPVHGRTGFSKSRGLQASVPFFPLPHPAPSTFLLSPHFLHSPNAKNSFVWPKFRSRSLGTLATQAIYFAEWRFFMFVVTNFCGSN